jgi:hypothetical protein
MATPRNNVILLHPVTLCNFDLGIMIPASNIITYSNDGTKETLFQDVPYRETCRPDGQLKYFRKR